MDAVQAWRGGTDGGSGTIGSFLQRFGIYVFLISIASAYYLLNAPILLGHYDLGWHLAAGDLIRARGSIPLHDPWSFTAATKPWINLSWLWDVIASLLFQETGFGGLVAVDRCLRRRHRRHISPPSACAAAPRRSRFASPSCRRLCFIPPSRRSPMSISPLRPTWRQCCLPSSSMANACGQAGAWFLLPALMMLWANLHGGFLIGLFIVGFFGAVALLRRDWRNFKIYGAVAAACFIAALVNPLGWHIYQGTTATLGNLCRPRSPSGCPIIATSRCQAAFPASSTF